MSKNDWTSKLRDQLADYQEPASHDLWAGIESSLAQMDNQIDEKAPSIQPHVAIKRWMAAAAAIAFLGVWGSYVYLSQDSGRTTSYDSGKPALLATDQSSADGLAKKVIAKNPSAMKGNTAISAAKTTTLLVAENGPVNRNGHQKVDNKIVSSVDATLIHGYTDEASNVSSNGIALGDNAVALNDNRSAVATASSVPSARVYNNLSDRKYESSSGVGSYDFSLPEPQAITWSVNLYAENVMTNSQTDASNGPWVASDPMSGGEFASGGPLVDPGNLTDKATFFAATPWLRASRYQKAQHHAPLAIGMQVGIGLMPRVTLSTGVVYTRTSSDFQLNGVDDYTVHQVLHYVGVPLGLNYRVWGKNGFSTYVMAGGEVDFNVKNDTKDSGVKEDAKLDRPQFSAKASVGLQYDFTPLVGVYVEPGAKYYFDNGSDIENTFKDKKLNFNFQLGLRWNIGR